LFCFGVILMAHLPQDRFAIAANRISLAIAPVSAGVSGNGLPGQFLLGLTLGLVWSPCVGPTLGAAFAARARELPRAVMTMLAFALGATLPLIVFAPACGTAARLTVGRRTPREDGFGGFRVAHRSRRPRQRLEAMLVSALPARLTRLSTSL
jgi:cytochrome c biogenesis protein CcdA